MLLLPGPAAAIAYGVQDPRALAMGGATVAAATSAHAMLYNPALLAIYDERKERNGAQRFQFPIASVQTTDAAEALYELNRDDLDQRLTAAVATFNAAPTAANAGAVAVATRDLEDALIRIANKDLLVDGYVGLAIGVPGKREGGGFFAGSRLVGGGFANLSDADRALLDAYIDGMTYIATGGAQGSPQPGIFDAGGNLIDPTDSLTSMLNARGALISEMGVALAREFNLFDWPVALGIAPKAVHVQVYEYRQTVTDDLNTTSNGRREYDDFNLDVGATTALDGHYRLGIGIKDVLPRDYETALGGAVKLRPRVRAGIAHRSGNMQLAADLDLTRNAPVGFESATRELAVGAEWAATDWLQLRGGYRANLEASGGLVSLGAGVTVSGALLDLAYGHGRETRALALQFGVAF